AHRRQPDDAAAVGFARARIHLTGTDGRGNGHGGRASARARAARHVSDADRERLRQLRDEIAAVDDELVSLLARRLALAREIGEIKTSLGIPVLDPAREAEVVRRAAADARQHGVDPELVRAVLWRIID